MIEMRILIVEDEPKIARLISRNLGRMGFACDVSSNLAHAFEALRSHPYELMMLDRRLPDGDGAEAIPAIRAISPGVRIVMVSAIDVPEEKAKSLDSGADDYIAKPFHMEELSARVRARLRASVAETPPPIRAGALSFDVVRRQIALDGSPFLLHKREFELLAELIIRVNCVVSRATLFGAIYGYDDEVQSWALDAVISRLRRRLLEANAKVEIHLVRGRGYILMETQP
jgi:DNA-binding response OmpR family regulator